MTTQDSISLCFAVKVAVDQLPRLFTYQYVTRLAQPFYPARHVDRVAPQVECQLASTDDATDDGS